LAGLGYGTQFAPELNEEHRIVDAPVPPNGSDEDDPRAAAPTNRTKTPPAPTGQNRTTNPQPCNASQNTRTTPQDICTRTQPTPKPGTSGPVFDSNPRTVTQPQLESIRKLHEALGKEPLLEPDMLSQLAAAKHIQELTVEYRQRHSKAS